MPLTLAATNQPGDLAETLRSIRADLALTDADADLGFVGPVVTEVEVTEVVEEPALAIPSLRITSMLEGQRPLAVVNGKACTVGDEIAGATVVQIGDGRVVFQIGERLFDVPVERPDAP